LGQLQNKAASAALSNILRDVNEHPMVRHEAAEALGSIAGIASKTLWNHATSVAISNIQKPCFVVSIMYTN
jgi:deoxyhypusine monooxygenase